MSIHNDPVAPNNMIPYHNFYTYTFDGYASNHPLGNTANIDTISKLIHNRPFIAPGIMKLYKEDIIVHKIKTCYSTIPQKKLQIRHPYVNGKSGFVIFTLNDMPESQDTKTIYSSFVILQEGITMCDSIIKTCNHPSIMYFGPNGYLMEYNGPVNSQGFARFIKNMYKC